MIPNKRHHIFKEAVCFHGQWIPQWGLIVGDPQVCLDVQLLDNKLSSVSLSWTTGERCKSHNSYLD